MPDTTIIRRQPTARKIAPGLDGVLRRPLNRRRVRLLVTNVVGFALSPFAPVLGLPIVAGAWVWFGISTQRPGYQRDKMIYDAADRLKSDLPEDGQHALYLLSKSLEFELLDEQDFRTMSLLSDNGHYRDLLPRVLRAAKHHPDMGILHLTIGRCYFHAADYPKAIESCAAIGVEDEMYAKALIMAGLAYDRLGTPERGIKTIQNGVAKRKAEGDDLIEMQYTLAKLHEQTGDKESARRLYEMVCKADAGFKNARSRLKRLSAPTEPSDSNPAAQTT